MRPAPTAGALRHSAADPRPVGGHPPRSVAAPVGPASLPALATPGFPGPVIPPLVAVIAMIVTTAYATMYALIQWGTLGDADVFFTAAAPGVLGSPFFGYESISDWLHYGPFGGGWTIAIPLVMVVVLTAILVSRTNVGAGARAVIGGLVFVPLALFAATSMFLANQLAEYTFYGMGEAVLRAAGGGALVGFVGGVLGGLLSLAIRSPLTTDRWRRLL